MLNALVAELATATGAHVIVVRDDAVLLDPRTLHAGDEKHVEEALRSALQ